MKWIEITDQVPEDGAKVYTFFEITGVEIATYNNLRGTDDEIFGYDFFYNKKGFLTDDVTHWMPIEDESSPLPAPPHLKMYILILDWVDLGHAINSAGHAGLMGYLAWKDDDPLIETWLNTSFRKVTCKVNQKEFEKAKEYDYYEIVTELAFDGKEVGLVFKPRYLWPKFFKYLKLYK